MDETGGNCSADPCPDITGRLGHTRDVGHASSLAAIAGPLDILAPDDASRLAAIAGHLDILAPDDASRLAAIAGHLDRPVSDRALGA